MTVVSYHRLNYIHIPMSLPEVKCFTLAKKLSAIETQFQRFITVIFYFGTMTARLNIGQAE